MTHQDTQNHLAEIEKNDLEEGSRLLIKGNFSAAMDLYSQILDKNPYSSAAEAGYRISRFWMHRRDILEKILNQNRQLKQFIETWEHYEHFTRQHQIRESQAHWSTLIFLHNQLAYLMPHLQEILSALDHDFRLILKFGEIFIHLGDWQNAIQALESARSLKKDDPVILALLGEAYCQENNMYRGLAMFREAFFLDTQKISLEMIQCKVIQDLIAEMRQSGIKEEDMASWLPVFAALYGVFTVKRSLSQMQLEDLNRDTLHLEETYRLNRDHTQILPRLLNHYLWLLDYYYVQEQNKISVGEIINRIKTLDPQLYNLLVATYPL